MVKVDLSRDYYGDLELPPAADVAEIKKQFRKLALKYHPDRNPGKEAEVNAKFQTIQSAHEVLTNIEQKSKYDAHRSRSNRYPSASGVKGNPWQDVSNQYPTPPKRAPTAARPSAARPATNSGASRYSSWMPPSQKSPRDSAGDNMRAWDRMRPSSSSRPNENPANQSSPQPKPRRQRPADPKPTNQQQQPPPPPPPRTESQRKKAEASFGTRKTPFVQVGDEPPVTSKNYFTTKQHTSLFNDASSAASAGAKPRPKSDYLDPLGQQFRDTYLDERQSTPYSSHSGEKTNPFDGADLGRSGSMRDPGTRSPRNATDGAHPYGASGRQRSSSVPDESENIKQATRESTGTTNPFGGTSKFAFSSRAGERYQPRDNTTNPAASASGPSTNPNSSSSSLNNPHVTVNGDASSKAKGGPTVYAPPFTSFTSRAHSAKQHNTHPLHSRRRVDEGVQRAEQQAMLADVLAKASPSGDQQGPRVHLNAFENKQHDVLHNLINSKMESTSDKRESPGERTPYQQDTCHAYDHADQTKPSSFAMPVDGDTFTATTPNRFMRNSTDNINTRFVAEEFADNDWHFQAGGPSEDAFVAAKRQARSKSRNDRQSPARSDLRFQNATTSPPKPSEATAQRPNGFNPEQWNATIGPQNFVPQPAQGPSSSPTRNPSRPAKKPKPVRMTAGTAGMVDSEDSSSEERTRPGTSAEEVRGTAPFATDSPSAMDIDSPPAEPTIPQPSGAARGIPVEPSKPEWRAGVFNEPKAGAKPSGSHAHLKENARGSEDSDGFLHSNLFADFKNVAPFAQQPSGLGSLSDLKSDLPFESRASAKIPVEKEAATAKPITFPPRPTAPRPPPALAVPGLKPSAVAWKTYVQAFHVYMSDFAEFNARYADHFAARRRLIDQNRKDTGFNWIESRGDTGIREYLRWLEEDKIVRQEWTVVSDAHEMRVQEFARCRDKMMQ